MSINLRSASVSVRRRRAVHSWTGFLAGHSNRCSRTLPRRKSSLAKICANFRNCSKGKGEKNEHVYRGVGPRFCASVFARSPGPVDPAPLQVALVAQVALRALASSRVATFAAGKLQQRAELV